MRIIIIDDELLIVKALASTLTSAGHDVIGKAGDVQRGLELIENGEIDLAIVDANLDGASAEPLIKKLTERGIPAMLISGYSDKQHPHWARSVQFLSKPFGPEELLKIVSSMRH